ncbi:MAG: cysteine desulfurase [Acidobacteria bacterium]|nr:cysteine desulfurase [Acidobacteriota bacterium]
MNRCYFDHNATAPPHPAALAAFAEVSQEVFGNPSSVHREGQAARQRLESARGWVSDLLGCGKKDLAFTSGGTEAANLAVLGVVRAAGTIGTHVITSAIEHPAVLNACAQLEREGAAVTYVRPDSRGRIDPEEVSNALRSETVLVSVMHANNETGVLQPVAEIARLAREAGVLMHSDGVQAVGKIPVNVRDLGVDLYSISGHKFGGLKGTGALYVRDGVHVQPLLFGGRHERNRRAGTENAAGAYAMGMAAGRLVDYTPVARLRDRLEAAVLERVPGVSVNGAGAERIPNTVNMCFDGIEGESMVIALDLRGFAVSSGSACSSGAVEPSHVLLAMGLPRDRAKSSLRFSLGPSNTEDEVDRLADAIAASCDHLRKLSPVYACS